MDELSKEAAARKEAIFKGMSPRRQKYILKRGYEQWDPFITPKDPIDIRKDGTHRTTQMLVREFLQSRSGEVCSNQYSQAVLDMALGLVNGDERYQAMYDFSIWYRKLLLKDGEH